MEGTPLSVEQPDEEERRKKKLEEHEAREDRLKKPENVRFLSIESEPAEPTALEAAWARTAERPPEPDEVEKEPPRPGTEIAPDPPSGSTPEVTPPVPDEEAEAPPPIPPPPVEILPQEPARPGETVQPEPVPVEAAEPAPEPEPAPVPEAAPETPETPPGPPPPQERTPELPPEPEPLPASAPMEQPAPPPEAVVENPPPSPEASSETPLAEVPDAETPPMESVPKVEVPHPPETVEVPLPPAPEAVSAPEPPLAVQETAPPSEEHVAEQSVLETPPVEQSSEEKHQESEHSPYRFEEDGREVGGQQAAAQAENYQTGPQPASAPELSRSSRAAEQKMDVESAPKGPLAGRNVETLSRQEMLDIAEEIMIDDKSLKHAFETQMIGEHGLRRLLAEYQQGGDMREALRREILEHQIDFERDPAMRDMAAQSQAQSHDPNSEAGDDFINRLLQNSSDEPPHQHQEETSAHDSLPPIYQTDDSHAWHSSRNRSKALLDALFVSVISILSLLVIFIYLSRR